MGMPYSSMARHAGAVAIPQERRRHFFGIGCSRPGPFSPPKSRSRAIRENGKRCSSRPSLAWTERWRRREATGDMIIVRYADDFIIVTEAAAEAIVQTPVALLGTLFSVPGGASAALGTARLLGRNYPLVLLLVLIGALFWPTGEHRHLDDHADEGTGKPNGSDHMPSSMRH